jgi:hypothetical protein
MPNVSEHHAQHDPLVVASLAAGDLSGAERDHATAQIAECGACAELHDDLLAIARATAALPSAVAPRDFRLTPEQAAALRPAGWRRLVAAFGRSRPLMSRQLGIGLATMGLAGLLVSTLPGIQLGSPASMPVGAGSAAGNGDVQTEQAGNPDKVTTAGEGAASAAPAAPAASAPAALTPSYGDGSNRSLAAPSSGLVGGTAVGAGSEGPPAVPGPTDAEYFAASNASQAPAANQGTNRDPLVGETAPSVDGRGLLILGSVVALITGIALLLIRRLARRPV